MHDFPPQEVPHRLVVKMELEVVMVSKAQSQHFLWVTQILTHSWPHLQQPALTAAYKPHKAFDLCICST